MRLRDSEHPLVLRTDFSSESAWEAICSAIRTPVDGFHAYVRFVDDLAYAGMGETQIRELLAGANQGFVILADRPSMADPEHPLLVVDLLDEGAGSFRAVPSTVQAIENNLSIANMDFEDFSGSVDADGVFRGFPRR